MDRARPGQLVAESPAAREEAAEVVGDWETSFSDVDKRLLVRVLSLLATAEESDRVREAQLDAMIGIFLPPYATSADVAPVFEIPAATLTFQDREYVDGFREILRDFPDVP